MQVAGQEGIVLTAQFSPTALHLRHGTRFISAERIQTMRSRQGRACRTGHVGMRGMR